MPEIRITGPATGADLGTFTGTVGSDSDSVAVTSFKFPSAISGLPRLIDVYDGDTATVDVTGLTNVTNYNFKVDGVSQQSSATATFDTTGHGGGILTVEVTADPSSTVYTSPGVEVYESIMAGHDETDAAILALVPHDEVTHIAVADGDWTDTATWKDGNLPRNGAFVLIPAGRSVTYDETGLYRLDRVRIDGTLTVTTAASTATKMLVETMVCTRPGSFICGTSSNRMPTTSSFTLTISGKDYSAQSYVPTDMKASNFLDTLGWGRGFICQGLCRIWGMEKTTWLKAAAPVPSGATSLILASAPVGWTDSDTIIIGGTEFGYTDSVTPITTEDEERPIATIDGAEITWSTPLDNSHECQLSGYTQDDLVPVVAVKGGGNVIFQSEVSSPVYRRGHFAMVHHHSTTDIWGLNCLDMGRTDKTNYGGTIDTTQSAGSEFKVVSPDGANGRTDFISVTPQRNLISRYPIHLHHVGFNHDTAGRPRPIVRDCYVGQTDGIAYVHHACDVDFFNCVGYEFKGSGMMGEAGNEVGAWKDCLMLKTTTPRAVRYTGGPKQFEESIQWMSGDLGAYGYGYIMRGRGMRVVGCVANSVTYGFVFLHRVFTLDDYIISPQLDLDRTGIDLHDAGRWNGSATWDKWFYRDYPITHLADIEIIASVSGLFVTKDNSDHFHDVNVRFKRIRTWGWYKNGLGPEYVQNYLFEDCESIAGNNAAVQSEALHAKGSTYQIGFVRCRTVGGNVSVRMSASEDPQGAHGLFNNTNSPRYYIIGLDSVNPTTSVTAGGDVGKPLADVLFEDADLQSDGYSDSQDPVFTYSTLKMGDFDGSTTTYTNDNTTGGKTDTLGVDTAMQPKPADTLFPNSPNYYRLQRGYYQHPDGGSNNVIGGPMFISDRVTGRPAKYTVWFDYTSGTPGGTDNGDFGLSATPVSVSDKTETVATDGSVVVNVLSPAPTGGDGVTYELDYNNDEHDHLKPDHGVAVLDEVAGTVTYTPDPGYVGTDEMTVFIRSGRQYGTMRIYFLVGPGGAVTAPAPTTNFTVADGGSQSIDVTLVTQPSCGGRFIRVTEYSTDAGATWRRLCNRFPLTTINITVESDGTAIAAGSYDVRLRYKTNYDFSTSAASADASVTVA